MRILLVKTSSLGDVIHNLPVVSDLLCSFPDAQIDWCVEESFADIPRLHPGVRQVIPVAIRRWRKQLTQRATWREIAEFRRQLSSQRYDIVLDTQGLLKSALIAWQANGIRCGYAAEAAREPLAARFYDFTFLIPRNIHAVQRNRWLAAAALDYPVDLPLDYGIVAPDLSETSEASGSSGRWPPDGRYALLFTATSRDDKLWAENNWIALALALTQRGLIPVLPSGNSLERQRASRIAACVPGAMLAPSLNLTEMTALIGHAALAVGVDTGLAHLAAALRTPIIALYVTTDPVLTGVFGSGFVRNLGAPGQSSSVEEVMTVVEQALRA